ncbi:MAG: hypothetical protein ACI92G_002878 [Candidatus Pelagisphaera sp.]|jgi:hypothetical protein
MKYRTFAIGQFIMFAIITTSAYGQKKALYIGPVTVIDALESRGKSLISC